VSSPKINFTGRYGLFLIVGAMGAGKSLCGTMVCADELVHGNRYIITNCKIDLTLLHEWALGEGFDPDMGRIRLVPDEDFQVMSQAWRIRQNYTLGGKPVEIIREGHTVRDYHFLPLLPDDPGCLVVFDEAHKVFPAEAYSDLRSSYELKAATENLRRWRDTWVLLTHWEKKIAPQVRGMAQSTIRLRNWGKRRVQWFRAPRVFHGLEREGVDPLAPLCGDIVFKLPAGLCDTFATDAATGGSGNGADKNEKVAPLPAWTLFLIVGLVIAVLIMAPMAISKIMQKKMGLIGSDPKAKAATESGKGNPTGTVQLTQPVPPSSVFGRNTGVVTGYARYNNETHFWLEDGTKLDVNNEVRWTNRGLEFPDGRTYRVKLK